MTQCQGKQYDNTRCPRHSISGEQWCIFHLPNKDLDLVEKFDDEFAHEYEKQMSKTVDPILDFTGFHFPSEMVFKGNLPACSFKYAVFYEDVYFGKENQHCQINGPLLFEYGIFKGNVRFYRSNLQKGVNFMRSKFMGYLEFYSVHSFEFTSFQQAEFIGQVRFQDSTLSKCIFQSSTFKNKVHFTDTTFFELADFRNSLFKDSTYIEGVNFQGQVDFQGVTFEKRADIRVVFDKKVTFNGATFFQLAHFDNSRFDEVATFRSTNFKGTAAFRRLSFEQGVDFTGVNFFNGALFDYSEFNKVSNFDRILIHDNLSFNQISVTGRFLFNVLNWGDSQRTDKTTLVMFNDPIISENGKIVLHGTLGEVKDNRIKGISLLNTELERIEFINEKWPHLNNIHSRKICIDEYLLEQYDTEVLTILHYDVTAQQVSQLYRRLRENYERAKRYSEAGDFLIGEMEMRRKSDPSIYNRQLLRFYKELALYGESLGRPLILSGLLILLATEFIVLFVENPQNPTEFISMFSKVMPTVIMSFFPLGQATTFYYFIIKLLGSLLLGTMFIAVRRKLERQ